MANRRKLREYAVQILYGLDFYDMPAVTALAVFESHFSEDLVDDGFLAAVIKGVQSYREEVDAFIRQFSTNWRLERMAIVDRNILRMATFELLHLKDVPRKVSINEAIEVAKRYGGDDSPSFINGILDRIALEVRGPETEEEKEKASVDDEPPSTAEGENEDA